MTASHMIFYFFAALAVGSAISVITARHPVRSVLSLVVTFFSMAGIWMLLRAEFLSLILLLVYVGAVMTLFLFVVMMLNVNREEKTSGFVRYLPFGVLVVLIITGITMMAVESRYLNIPALPLSALPVAQTSNLQQLGQLLYVDYAYPFEIAGVILLAAMIAAISLTHRAPRRCKVQRPNDQINVRPEDRVRLISMASEQKQSRLS